MAALWRLSVMFLAVWMTGVGVLGTAAEPASEDAPAADEQGFVSIFDGTLDGWEGKSEFWSVADNAIVGQTTPENPTKGNTFIFWRQGELDDFELRLSYRITGGNSGIQYRSRDFGDFVAGGYQADIDSGTTYSGINYEERGRGILVTRGKRMEIGPDGMKTEGEAIGESDALQAKINQGEWNDYRIVAEGPRLRHYINGQLMSEVIDHEVEKRAEKGILALQLHAGPPMKVEFKNIRLKRLKLADGRKKVVFVAGRQSHGPGEHEFRAGSMLMADCLEANCPEAVTAVYTNGWPTDPTAFDNADAIHFFADGGGGHPVIQRNRLTEIAALAKRGVGIACLHYAVEVPPEKGGAEFLDMIGGFFETHWSVNPHWMLAETRLAEGHPITRGVQPFEIQDEWYYHMRFRDGDERVVPILSAVPPDATRERPDGPHSNNPTVRSSKGAREVLAWAYERPDGGRGFGCTGAHFHRNFGDAEFRKLMLNAVAWTAGLEIPQDGILSEVSADALAANLDPK